MSITICDTCCQKCYQAVSAFICRPMIVCKVCGNKCCPKASDHTLECTGSNAPGQPGSGYA